MWFLMSKETAWKWIEDHKDELAEVSDEVWGFAEYGLLEERSSKLIASTLERHGFRVKLGVAGMPTTMTVEGTAGSCQNLTNCSKV